MRGDVDTERRGCIHRRDAEDAEKDVGGINRIDRILEGKEMKDMDKKDEVDTIPPPNPPPAGDNGEPTPNPSQEGNKLVPGFDRGSEIGRDYTRAVYQNLMAVVELLDKKSPMPVSQKQIQEELGLSKGVVYDICWNLCKFGWARDDGDGKVRFTRGIFFR